MRRRLYSLAWFALLSLVGFASLTPETAQANEPAAAACADGSCAGGVYGGGAFGLGLGGAYGCLPHDYLNPHLFYNFYVGGNCGSIPAGMYPSPMPTPPIVGHTFYTYQPLLPHEFMYAHKRVYHHHYNYNRGLHRTRVVWAW